MLDYAARMAARAILKRRVTHLRTHLATFQRDEDGALVIFSLYLVLIMMIVGGLGVDFMRNEMERTKLQHTLDRAILAAADLDQTLDPEAVVNDYFTKSGMKDYLASVEVSEGLNWREVSASASLQTTTQFLHMVGLDTITAPAGGTAEERMEKVEISMVLDISGSMGHYAGKMQNLRDAASTFVDTVLQEDTEDLISISIVPYTAHVNAGPLIFDELPVNQVHQYSHCVEFLDSEFQTTELDTSRTYDQGQHVEWSSGSHRGITNPGCPDEDFERITPLSQDADALKDQISQMVPRANTSIHLGMKWGVALLDPSFNTITSALVSSGDIDAEFASRPVAYDDPETLKTVILMTDGENVTTRRVEDWAYNHPNEYAHWNTYPFYNYLNWYVNSSWHSQFYYTKYTPSDGDALLQDVCDAAKDEGIIIWSIGFEVGNHGASVMADCASSPSHFFRVEGIEIQTAFEQIARQINQLRLTQ